MIVFTQKLRIKETMLLSTTSRFVPFTDTRSSELVLPVISAYTTQIGVSELQNLLTPLAESGAGKSRPFVLPP
jgi:hypothetical protein